MPTIGDPLGGPSYKPQWMRDREAAERADRVNVVAFPVIKRIAITTPTPAQPRSVVIEWIKREGMTRAAERILDDSERIVKIGALLREVRAIQGITDDHTPCDVSAAVAGKLNYAIAIAEGTAK